MMIIFIFRQCYFIIIYIVFSIIYIFGFSFTIFIFGLIFRLWFNF